MSLAELVDGVETHCETHTAFGTDGTSVESLRDQFAAHDVAVKTVEPAAVPGETTTLGGGEELVTVTPGPDLLDTPAPDPFAEEADDPPPEALDRTTFATFDAGELLAVARRVEDRAWRVGNGRLHAGFQTLEGLDGELDVYERLGDRSGLHVDAYAAAEGAMPDHDDSLAVHVERSEEVRSTRFVVYDGGGTDGQKCALVAEEREPGAYCGFRTSDADTVDYICSYLEASYPLVPAAGSRPG